MVTAQEQEISRKLVDHRRVSRYKRRRSGKERACRSMAGFIDESEREKESKVRPGDRNPYAAELGEMRACRCDAKTKPLRACVTRSKKHGGREGQKEGRSFAVELRQLTFKHSGDQRLPARDSVQLTDGCVWNVAFSDTSLPSSPTTPALDRCSNLMSKVLDWETFDEHNSGAVLMGTQLPDQSPVSSILNKKRVLVITTYGKLRRKVSAWISPDDRRQAFDSTASTDETSVVEAANRERTREKRTAKKKAIQSLTEKSSDEENIVPSPPSPPRRATRGKKASVCIGGAVRPAKRKTKPCLTETSSNEDNIKRPSSPPAQRRKTTRKGRLVSAPVFTRQRGKRVSVTSESEDESSAPKRQKLLLKVKADSSGHFPSAGRFVTRRRGAASTKVLTAIANAVSSSDEFTFGASRRIHRPSGRRKGPPAFQLSSSESSGNATGTSNFATNPFREISLNESAEHILGPCPRKPIFCSTPSAGSFGKRSHAKPFLTRDQVTSPPSFVGVLSTFQEDLASPQQPVSPPQSASVCELHSEERLQREPGVHHNEEPSVDLFMEPERVSSSEGAKSHSGDCEMKGDGELPTENVLSAHSESSSHFVSAAGGFEWLVEALKEKCLSQHCTVQLERLAYPTVTQLCSQTTYSSCLEQSSSVHSRSSRKQPESVDSESFNRQFSDTANKTGDGFLYANSFEESASVTDSHGASLSALADYKKSPEDLDIKAQMERSESVLYVDSFQQTDESCEIILGTQLPARSTLPTRFIKEEASTAKCLSKKCLVQLPKLSLSQQTVQQVKAAGLDFRMKSGNQEARQNEEESVRCSGEAAESKDNKSPGDEKVTTSTDPETAAVATSMLKNKCQTDRLIVTVKRATLSQLREMLPPKYADLKSSTDVSDSASDGQTKSHRNESAASSKVRTSGSGKEDGKNPGINVPKRKKASQALKEKKRRSTSTDRPGTTRKACVSGMSVSRWKNKGADSTLGFRTKAADCSITELITAQQKQLGELLGGAMNFSTPVRAGRLNLSSLLADFTPSTHTWSRLKAALSVHRKGRVQHTPRSVRLSPPDSLKRAALADVSQDLFATPLRTPHSRRLRSQLLREHSLVACEDADLSDAEKVYAECGQQHPLPWEECIPRHRMKQCVKIGEGTFGEVFSTTNASGDTVALKIIPLEGSEKVNGEDQKSFGEILHEIIISKELSSLKEKQQNQTHGFIGLNDLHCVQGCYPPDFLKAWDAFDQRKGSENDRPDFFEKDQFFIILEFEFGGVDLENSNGTLASLGVAKSILQQVTAALAVAEQELRFEHRDLHWGNVLVKTTRQKRGSFLLNGTTHSVETKGVLVRIIDYSLSRLEIDDLTVSCDISNDEELFMGQGDYQFDIYRLMRQENGNNWSNYHPHTNVLWLHYLCSKLLSMKYRNSGGRGAKDTRQDLTRFYDNVLQYSSATEALQNCPMFQ
ncbi:uncharacterized protein haspin [Leuresthes tenuis]|uniref:uncharacterized protein haspin n=1 Tax=Leuresthes tenuis TaxID=355514 RepID=UPI003B50D365